MWKACAFSNAARNGVFATDLARRGMTGPNDIFEGPKGLFNMITGPFELKWAERGDLLAPRLGRRRRRFAAHP